MVQTRNHTLTPAHSAVSRDARHYVRDHVTVARRDDVVNQRRRRRCRRRRRRRAVFNRKSPFGRAHARLQHDATMPHLQTQWALMTVVDEQLAVWRSNDATRCLIIGYRVRISRFHKSFVGDRRRRRAATFALLPFAGDIFSFQFSSLFRQTPQVASATHETAVWLRDVVVRWTIRGGLSRIAAWHLPDGPVGRPARCAAT